VSNLPGGATTEGKDAGEGGGGDPGEQRATEARHDALEGMMTEDAFDINTTPCGQKGWPALDFLSAGRANRTMRRP
jgi:hypothetical protein